MLSRDAHSVRLARAYVVDWLVALLLLVATFFIDRTTPFQRRFSVDDKTISYPFAVHETVPTSMLLVIISVVPLIIMLFMSVVLRKSPYDFHSSALGLLLSVSLTLTVTCVLKNTLGRLRPDFLDRCFRTDFLDRAQPAPPVVQDPMYGMTSMDVCIPKSDTHTFQDGMKSFPSGHASTSFAAMTFLSLFLAGKLHVFDKRGHTWKPFVVIIPLIVAALISISRICDYRHHWQDVVAGGMIGIVFATFSYYQYYPSIWSLRSEKPHSPRVPKLTLTAVDQVPNGVVHHSDGQGGPSVSMEVLSAQLSEGTELLDVPGANVEQRV